jgi:hypothetical protein
MNLRRHQLLIPQPSRMKVYHATGDQIIHEHLLHTGLLGGIRGPALSGMHFQWNLPKCEWQSIICTTRCDP